MRARVNLKQGLGFEILALGSWESGIGDFGLLCLSWVTREGFDSKLRSLGE